MFAALIDYAPLRLPPLKNEAPSGDVDAAILPTTSMAGAPVISHHQRRQRRSAPRSRKRAARIDILEVVTKSSRGLGFPLPCLRFQDLLRHRVEAVQLRSLPKGRSTSSVTRIITAAVFPIKVNRPAKSSKRSSMPARDWGISVSKRAATGAGRRARMHKDLESLSSATVKQGVALIRGLRCSAGSLAKSVIIVVEKLGRAPKAGHPRLQRKSVPNHTSASASVFIAKARASGRMSGGENAKFGLIPRVSSRRVRC